MEEKSIDETAHIDHVPDGVADPEANAARHQQLLRKIDWRLLPLCAFIYLLNYLDRSNIGNAKVLNAETGDSLQQQTGMTERGYSITLTLFAVAYSLFDVPSNWVLKRYARPSYWLGTLMLCWGAVTLGFARADNMPTVIVLRVLIGVFEAGFFPGMVYLITFWYRQDERSIRIAFILATSTLAGAFGGCIAYGVGFINGRGGLEGFRWLFIIEGAATVLVAPLAVFYLPNYPSTAKWLTISEQRFAMERLEQDGGVPSRDRASRDELRETIYSPRMLLHYLAYFTNNIVMSSLAYFSPSIVKGLGYTSIQAQLMTVPPWAVGYIISMLLAWSADRFNARGLHVCLAGILTGTGFLASRLLPATAYLARYGCLIVASCGAFPSAAPLTAWVTCNVPSSKTLGLAAALNNSMVGLASIVALWVWNAAEAGRGYPTGNAVCAGAGFATAGIALALHVFYTRENGKVGAGGEAQRAWAL
ncbi:major facilitator superfamily domain-containing protein [Aspergillus insuetus]